MADKSPPELQQSLELSLHQLPKTSPRPPTILKSRQSEAAGAEGSVEVEGGGAAAAVAPEEVPQTPATSLKIIVRRQTPTPIPETSLTRGVRNIQTCLLKPRGPVPSIGEKDEELRIAVTLLCASGCPLLPPDPLMPER